MFLQYKCSCQKISQRHLLSSRSAPSLGALTKGSTIWNGRALPPRLSSSQCEGLGNKMVGTGLIVRLKQLTTSRSSTQ